MRALILAPCPFLVMRGKPIRVLNNSLALALEGYELVILTYAEGDDIRGYLPEKFRRAAECIEIRRIRPPLRVDKDRPGLSLGKLVSTLSMYRAARRLLLEQRFDVLVCHDADGMLLGLALQHLARVPSIYDMHGSLTELMRNIHRSGSLTLRIAGWLERRLYAGADLILANWPHLLKEVGAANVDKTFLVQDRPPLTTTEAVHVGANSGEWKREHGIDRLLVYVGNFASYQRVDLLIEMMAVLAERRVRATLCLIGPGGEALEGLARRHPEADVRFLGPKYGDDLAQILASADVALSARVTTNYPPMKVITYLTAAIPVVATDCAAHRVMIDAGVTGLLASATAEAFAAAVSRLLGDDVLRERFREAARTRARRYAIDSLTAELRAALAGVPALAGRPAV
jgi:glycosyltransferase involved in cell wall biosynthesis